MAKVVVLGSACAVPDETHENTYLALAGARDLFLIDCAGQPVIRLHRAGFAFENVRGVILTHFHPDHVYGLPMLIVEMWLRGRRAPLTLYGLPECLERMEALMRAFQWEEWANLFPVHFQPAAAQANTLVVETEDFRITGAPVKHLVPTLALRLEDKMTGRVGVYSSDTEPCPALATLAQEADLLIHEATGAWPGHSSAAQAGEMAQAARAKRLALIHYVVAGAKPARLCAEAAQNFSGPVVLAEDFLSLEI